MVIGRPPERRHRISRVLGSTIVSRSEIHVGSASVSALRPPPARRTPPFALSDALPRNSSRPRPIVLRAIPVASETAAIPPHPAASASDAANDDDPARPERG